MRSRSFLLFSVAFAVASGHLVKRNIETGLASLLSLGASVYHPGSEGFIISNERFTELNRPDYQVVVRVATEEDVVATVCMHLALFGHIISLGG